MPLPPPTRTRTHTNERGRLCVECVRVSRANFCVSSLLCDHLPLAPPVDEMQI